MKPNISMVFVWMLGFAIALPNLRFFYFAQLNTERTRPTPPATIDYLDSEKSNRKVNGG